MEKNILQCRICLDENEDINDLIKPCNCDGTQKYVHRKCLDKWLEYNKEVKVCRECLYEYKFEEPNRNICSTIFNFFYKKNFLFSLIFSYLLFFLFGSFTFFLSENSNIKIYSVIVVFSKDYFFITTPIIGSVIFSILNLIYYSLHNLILRCYNEKNLEWKDSNGYKSSKILLFSMIISIFSVCFAPIGFIIAMVLNPIFYKHFIEFWFSKYIFKKKRVLDLETPFINNLV